MSNLRHVVDEVRAEMAPLGIEYEILIVDDGSSDGTGELADRLASEDGRIRVVHHRANLGINGAVVTCLREARGDWMYLSPADGQVPLETARRFYQGRDGYDIVVGVRTSRAEGWQRKLLSWLFHLISRWLFGIRLREFSSVFLYRMSLMRTFSLISRPRAATINPEVLYRAGRARARVGEMPIRHLPRLSGRAKGGTMRNAFASMWELVRLAVVLRIRR